MGRATLEIAATMGSEYTLTSVYNTLGERTVLMARNIYDPGSGVDTANDFMNPYGYDQQSRMTSVHQRGGTLSGSTIVGGAGVDEKYVEFAWKDDGRLRQVARHTNPAKTTAIGATNYAYDGRGSSFSKLIS